MRDALDGVVEYDPGLLVVHDLDPFSYTGNARFSQGFFDTAAQLGHPVVLGIQETYSSRSQEGHTSGVWDVQFAEQRMRERGFPLAGVIAYVVSDGSGGDVWDSTDYARGISDGASGDYRIGPGYGANGVLLPGWEAGVLAGSHGAWLFRGTDNLAARWVPETWPGGTNAVGQVVGPSPVPDTDLNRVYVELHPSAPAPDDDQEEEMRILASGGPFGDVAALVDGAYIVSDPDHLWMNDAQHPPVYGIPGQAVAWNEQTGRHYKYGFIEPAMMLRIIEHTKAAAGGQVGLTDAQVAAIGAAAGTAFVAALKAHPLAPTG